MSHARRTWRDQNQRCSPETISAGLAEANVLSHDGLDLQDMQ